jgi:radical SAM/Cys-rich protein
MSLKVIEQILFAINKFKIKTIDLTGGAPELNDHFEYLIIEAKKLGCHVIDRCNLTVLLEPGKTHLFNFFKNNKVEIIASLPCYEESNVDAQRGKSVFKKSIEVLKELNKSGYGYKRDLVINLVYNPQGPILPPNQLDLENKYKKILKEEHGIIFNNLYLITNMPIARFGSTLITKNEFNPYMKLLKNNFNEEALNHLMCKSLISIDYEGYIYDCDFNQMLRINLSDNIKKHISMLSKINILDKINVADHCYGCTAGSGSSCGGALL